MNPSSSNTYQNYKLKKDSKMTCEPATIDLHRFNHNKTLKDSSSLPKKTKETKMAFDAKASISNLTKDLNRRQNSLKLSTEVISIKELGKRYHPQTTTSHAVTKMNESKPVEASQRKKETINRNEVPNERKASKKMDEKDIIFNPSMKEPPKKSSMPTPLALTLNSLNANVGSSSCRAPLFSPHFDSNRGTNTLLQALLNKGSKSPESRKQTEVESRKVHRSKIKPFKSFQGEINNASDEVALNSTKPFSNQGIDNTNSAYVVCESEPNESVSLTKDRNFRSSYQRNLCNLLNGKKETSRGVLNNSKSKHLSGNFSQEIEHTHKTNATFESKDKTIEYVQTLPDEATVEFYDIKGELHQERVKIYGAKPNSTRTQLTSNRRLSSQPSPKNVEDVKKFVKQINKLSDGPEKTTRDPLGLKTTLLEKNLKETSSLIHGAIRKPRVAVSPNQEVKYKNSSKQTKQNNYHYPSSYQNTVDETYVKRKESLKDSQIFQDYMKKAKKFSREEFNNIPEELDLSFNKINVSHEPKNSFDRSFDVMNNKQFVYEGITSPFTDKDTSQETNLDIGKALNELKDKIKKVLKNHATDRKILNEVSQIFLQSGSRLYTS